MQHSSGTRPGLPLAAEDAKACDVAVVGAGPAGSTIGRLLAEWGYSVLILTKPEGRNPSLAESLPPSSRKLLHFLGILDHLDRRQFYRTTGNTAWWGQAQGRVERFLGAPDTSGFQVLRSDFDQLLLQLAETAGARVCRNATVRHVDIGAAGPASLEYETANGAKSRVTSRFILDCSGRAGVIARKGFRRKEHRYSTVAIAGVWGRDAGWDLEDETHTLIETYQDGWAWSVPISAQVRHFTVMLDPRVTEIARGKELEVIYRAELDKTREFRKVLSGATRQSPSWACDASLYSAQCFAGSNFLLVGDAASFIEPLSSFGVKKALASAWVGAVVVNTCCKRPEMQKAAFDFFSDHERRMYGSALKQSAYYFREAAMRHAHRFWQDRAGVPADADLQETDEEEWKRDPEVLAAFDALKRSPCIRLHRAEDVRTEKRAGIQGREFVLEEALVSPGIPEGLRFLAGVNLPRLVEIACQHGQVPDLFEAYNRVCPPVELPNFLTALSVLVARRVLKKLA